jgi:hypothetical protein
MPGHPRQAGAAGRVQEGERAGTSAETNSASAIGGGALARLLSTEQHADTSGARSCVARGARGAPKGACCRSVIVAPCPPATDVHMHITGSSGYYDET